MRNSENIGESYVNIQATPAQAQRLLELGAISESQARHASQAGGLMVRLPAHLVNQFRNNEPVSLPDSCTALAAKGETQSQPFDEEFELDKMANWFHRSGLNSAARLFFATNRPLSFFGSQFLLAMQPFTRTAFGLNDPTGCWSKLLEKRSNLDRLVCKLERLAQERRQQRGKK
ncbi:hypothetical protein [Candidatus Chlorohelix sp.]|uniref:hypothetical protein n=1 Tax=Candidatus Chlorohelix sp. TaxID=3139201 RepID=UPI0030687AE6